MKEIKISKPVNLTLLADELFASFPEWISAGFTNVSIKRGSVRFPDDTPTEAVQAVIDTHDHTRRSRIQRDNERLIEERGELASRPAWMDLTFAEVEEYILNNTVGSVTVQQATQAVDDASSLADIKIILKNIARTVYGIVGINVKLARVFLAVIRYVSRQL